MENKEKAKKITDCIYEAFGTNSGWLFGIHPESHDVVITIVEQTLKVLDFWKEKQACSGLEGIIKESDLYIDALDSARGFEAEAEIPKQVKDLAQTVLSWHKSERKKWTIDIIEEAKKFLLTTQSISMSSKIGVGIAIAEIREEVEED